MKKKVLFISHDDSRTGAPFVLLHLLKWITNNKTIDFSLLIKNREFGIEDEFRSIAKTYIWNQILPPRSFYMRALFELIHKSQQKIQLLDRKKHENTLLKQLKEENFSMIYANTVASLTLAVHLKNTLNIPLLVCHVHENEFTISHYFKKEFDNKVLLNQVDNFIAVSKNTKANLVVRHGIDKNKVNIFYEFIPTNNSIADLSDIALIKKKHGFLNEFVVGGSGMMSWRKGIDLFIQLAIKIQKMELEVQIKMIWIGKISQEIIDQYKYECNIQGIKDEIIFTGLIDNPIDYFRILDVFVLTSREDPFPLVCLENASLGKPLLCFENAGGIPEFLKDGGGFTIPYGDLDTMAERIIQLASDPVTVSKLGKEASENVKKYDVNVIAPELCAFILNELDKI